MEFGLSANVCATIRTVLARHPVIERAILYGSRAKGAYKNGSDIDLTLVGDGLEYKTLAAVAAELDDSDIPHTVDLSILAKIENPALREHIGRVGVVFYQRGGVADGTGGGGKAGWKTKKLGEVSSFLNRGISPKYLDTGGICVLNQKCVRDHRISFELARRHDDKAKKVGNERFLQVGDVLVNSTGTGTLGRVAQLRDNPPEPTTVDSHVTIIRPVPGKFYPEFFGYMMVVIEDAIKDSGEGCGGQTELARSVLAEKFLVNYPVSLPEQQRIVGILDEVFGGIATAKANAEKNLQNARALFASHLQAVFSQRGEGWVEKPLLKFAHSVSTGPFGSLLHKSDYVSDGLPLVNPINIVNGTIVPDGDKMIDPATKQRLQSYVLQEGDIVVGRRGEIGRCAVVDMGQAGWVCGTGCFFIRPLQTVNPYFLANLIRSSSYREQLEKSSSGSTMLNLSNKALGELPIAIPNLLEQHHILAQLDSLREETQRLESIYQQKLTALNALKKSLLDQAFSGQL